MESVYMPAEDSDLLLEAALDVLKGGRAIRILELGTGSGYILRELEKAAGENGLVCSFFGTDIRKEILKQAASNTKAKLVMARLFSGINGKFDLILFNPPYLPMTEDDHFLGQLEDALVNKGVIERFISEAGGHITGNGRCLLLIGNVTGRERMERLMEQHGFSFLICRKRSLFFERLFVYMLSKGKKTGKK